MSTGWSGVPERDSSTNNVCEIDTEAGTGQNAGVSGDWISDFYEDFGRRVRTVRSDAGMTQAELAAEIGLSRASVANLEAGRQRVPFHVLYGIARVLAVEPAQLMPEFGAPVHEEFDFSRLQEQLTEQGTTDDDRAFVLAAVRNAIGGPR